MTDDYAETTDTEDEEETTTTTAVPPSLKESTPPTTSSPKRHDNYDGEVKVDTPPQISNTIADPSEQQSVEKKKDAEENNNIINNKASSAVTNNEDEAPMMLHDDDQKDEKTKEDPSLSSDPFSPPEPKPSKSPVKDDDDHDDEFSPSEADVQVPTVDGEDEPSIAQDKDDEPKKVATNKDEGSQTTPDEGSVQDDDDDATESEDGEGDEKVEKEVQNNDDDNDGENDDKRDPKNKKEEESVRDKEEEHGDTRGKSKEEGEKEDVIECPLVQDILVGMGQALKAHPGNQRMVAIIAVHRDRYDAADEQGKKRLMKEVSSEVQRGGARFLKVNDNGTGWIRCSKKEIRRKGTLKNQIIDNLWNLFGTTVPSSFVCSLCVSRCSFGVPSTGERRPLRRKRYNVRC